VTSTVTISPVLWRMRRIMLGVTVTLSVGALACVLLLPWLEQVDHGLVTGSSTGINPRYDRQWTGMSAEAGSIGKEAFLVALLVVILAVTSLLLPSRWRGQCLVMDAGLALLCGLEVARLVGVTLDSLSPSIYYPEKWDGGAARVALGASIGAQVTGALLCGAGVAAGCAWLVAASRSRGGVQVSEPAADRAKGLGALHGSG
jgi:hypothetical protein